LLVPQLFMDAYSTTADEKYFRAAEQLIVGWAGYERQAWVPRGFLWNDHAVAARIHVLSDFWSAYRARPDFIPATAASLLAFVERPGALLAQPQNFTVTTNHGVMENLALLEICIAFPAFPEVSSWRQTAVSRLRTQFSFYVTDEGVILEHSAGYHAFGFHLMMILSRYLELL